MWPRISFDRLRFAFGSFVTDPISYLPVEICLLDSQVKVHLDLDQSWFSKRGLQPGVVDQASIREAFEAKDWLLDSIFTDDEWLSPGYYRYVVSKKHYEVHLMSRPTPKELEVELSS